MDLDSGNEQILDFISDPSARPARVAQTVQGPETESSTRTGVGNNMHLDTAGKPASLGNPHGYKGEDSVQREDEQMPLIKDADQGDGRKRGTEGEESEPILIQCDQDGALDLVKRNDGPHPMDLDDGGEQILNFIMDPSERLARTTQTVREPEAEQKVSVSVVSRPRIISEGNEADDTNMPKDEDSDLHFGMGNEDGAPESGLTTLDRDSTNRVGLTMEADPPKGFDIPRHRYTANMTNDNATSGRNSKRHPRIDSGDSEEDTELQDWIEEGRLQVNEAGTSTRSCKRRTGDHARKLAMHMQ
jgi:hypothetical protein